MSAFDYQLYQLHLAQERERQRELHLAWPVFNPQKHPHGAGGLFVATGSSGSGVQTIQQKVGAKQDGQYGAKTKAAVMEYQKKHGLVVDGIVGSQTAAQMLGGPKRGPGSLTAEQAKKLGLGSASKTKAKTKSKSKSAKPNIPEPAGLKQVLKNAD